MKNIKAGTKFISNPDTHLTVDMSRNRTYTILRFDNGVVYWMDDRGDIRSAHGALFHTRYITLTTELHEGCAVRCVSRAAGSYGPRSTFRDMTIGNQYLINRLDEEYIGWVDDRGEQCTAMRSYADDCFSIIVPNGGSQDEVSDATEMEVSLIQTLMENRGVPVNPEQASIMLSILDSMAKFKASV